MDNTARMIRLLGRLRREMNGAVAESMRYYGRDYGLNYGVSIPTIRSIARAEGCDHEFARYLYVQQVRELRLAALHIADPAAAEIGETDFWAAGIINSEVAEEAAFAFLSRAAWLPEIFGVWCSAGAYGGEEVCGGAARSELLAYAALMSGARARIVRTEPSACDTAVHVVGRYPHSRLVAQGAAALLGGALDAGDISRGEALRLVVSLPENDAAAYVAHEMSWRMEEH